jgi:uncharacterized protein YndB with AHSA1/START domain
MTNTRKVTFSTFTLERTFAASPARVFRAFSDPKIKKRWFSGPPEWGEDEMTMDFRVGGTDTSKGGPPGGPVSLYRGTYQDILEPTPSSPGRIISTYDMQLNDVRISVSLHTVEIVPLAKGTRLVLTEQGAFLDGFDDPKLREEGFRQILGQLAADIEKHPE